MKRWLLVLIPLVILGGLIGWRLNQKKAEAAAQAKARTSRAKMAPVVTLATASIRDVVHTYEGVGNIEAPLNVKLASKVTGRIVYLNVHEGDHVLAGQTLIRLDPSEVLAQVHQQESTVAEDQARLSQAIITQNPVSVSITTSIRQQQASVNSAKADFTQTQQNYQLQMAAAESNVTDIQGRVSAATSAVESAKASVGSAQANLNNATSKFNRINNLYKQGFIAAQDVDDARTTVSVQKGALDVANGQLDAATAQLGSARAQLDSARKQADIVKTKGVSDVEASRARLTQAEAALEMAKSNTVQKPAYQANLTALKAVVDASKASLRNLRAQLADTEITSPMDGFVTDRLMDPGAMATPGAQILTIQSINQVWVTIPIPEEVSRHVSVGQMVDVTLDALPGKTFKGKITQFNPSADPQSRQFSARVTLENSRNMLKPGMFARITIVTERIRDAIVVPREAVHTLKTGPTVMVVDSSNMAHTREVETGASDNNGIAIVSGLSSGEKVIIMSALPVKDGTAIRTSAGSGKKRQGGKRP